VPGHRLAPRVRVHATAPLAPLAPLSARAAEGAAAAAAFAGGARARAPALAARGAAAAAALEAPRPCEVGCEVVAVRHLDAAGLEELEAAASDAAGGAVAAEGAEEMGGCGGAAVHGCAVWLRLSGAPTQATLRISHEPSAAASAARRDQQEAALAGTALAGAPLEREQESEQESEQEREEEREQEREQESEQEAPGLWAAARGGGGGGGGGGGAALGAAPAEVLPAEVSLHLTGPALVLHASCASSSAVSGQLVGPVTLHALDAARHQVCGAHFEPRLAARRPQTAEATAAAAEAAEAAEAEAEAGAGAGAAAAAGAGAVQCTIERTEWQRSPSGACELAQVWLRLSGEPGEVELTPHPTRTLALTLSLTWP